MREVQNIILGEGTSFDQQSRQSSVIALKNCWSVPLTCRHVPAPGDYGRVITRIHCKWRQHSSSSRSPTLPKKVDFKLDPYRGYICVVITLDSND